MTPPEPPQPSRWYEGITRYQWLVLVIASLGWVFDVFEGQIFVASMNKAMPDLAPTADTGTLQWYSDVALAAFNLGGALGGLIFGVLSDRIGRRATMIYTILMYSAFTCISALAQNWWQMAGLRFLVAMGVGGEWAVASALVAEVFPQRARAWSLGIFHASSVFGTYLATAAGAVIVANPNLGWRWGFALGALPSLLTIWIRWSMREPETWTQAREAARLNVALRLGRVRDLFAAGIASRTFVGLSLATIGLTTFWGVHIHGREVLRRLVQDEYRAQLPSSQADLDKAVQQEFGDSIYRWEMLGMFLVTTGGGLGLVCFGPLCERIGRRGAFLFYHVGGLISSLVLFQWLAFSTVTAVASFLPLFGFLTLGMHAGYAIYFPELFPTRVRGTGGGFCFNGGRVLVTPLLLLSGLMKSDWQMSLADTASLLSLLYALGILVLLFAPETKGQELPE